MKVATPTTDAGGVPHHGLATDTWLGPHEISGLWEQSRGVSSDLSLFDKSPHTWEENARLRSPPTNSPVSLTQLAGIDPCLVSTGTSKL